VVERLMKFQEKQMGKYLVVLVMGWITLAAAGEEGPGIAELMGKYAETQDKARTSFISKATETTIATYNFPDLGVNAKDVKTYKIEEFQTDGNCLKIIHRRWGWMNSKDPDRGEDHKAHNSWLWDGDKYYCYVKGLKGEEAPEGYPGKLFLDQRKDKNRIKQDARLNDMAHNYPFSGYFIGTGERIDKVLHAGNAAVDRDIEIVEGSACYVITATPKKGNRIKIWIDPQHGHNIIKFESRTNESKTGAWRIWGGKVLRFGRNNDLWIPMEMETEYESKTPKIGYYQHTKARYAVTEFMVNPDHGKLGSFLPDDIRNGAWVMLTGQEGITYTWQDGKVVDKAGKVVDLRASKADDPNQPAAGEGDIW